jgi:hypothetical protein
LYFNNWDYYSTKFSGIVTIICVGIILTYAIVVLNGIFQKKVKEIYQTGRPIEHNVVERVVN